MIHWKTKGHKWNTRRKKILAESIVKAVDIGISEETRPGRWDVHGRGKLAAEVIHGTW